MDDVTLADIDRCLATHSVPANHKADHSIRFEWQEKHVAFLRRLLAERDAALQIAKCERDEQGEKAEQLEADIDTAETCIGKLQALVRNVEYWVTHGCSETATKALRSAMAAGWSEMGWLEICERKRQRRAPTTQNAPGALQTGESGQVQG